MDYFRQLGQYQVESITHEDEVGIVSHLGPRLRSALRNKACGMYGNKDLLGG